MEVQLNGESRKLPDKTSVAWLLDDLGVSTGQIVVEINGRVLDRLSYDHTLCPGDLVEVVEFVGGG